VHVIFGERALADLREIWEFLAEGSETVADRVVLELIERAESIGERPLAAALVPDLADQRIRRVMLRDWAILYEVREGFIDVHRIVSGRKDLTSFTW
jgi:plasmid stabilization system protein ParE